MERTPAEAAAGFPEALRGEVTDSTSPDVANVKFTVDLGRVMLLVGVEVRLNQAAVNLSDRRRIPPQAAV